MVRITQDLVRRKAEHNEGEISSLEELTLHQQDIEKIEHLDKWCRQLKILYLQSNLIPRIESVGRLKKLEYLNLALNNVELIENLEGCESLKKLDLTVNFVGELTSVEILKNHVHFRDLYLTGNPCTQYDGYRDYVIAALPRLETLDGQAIEKSERIKATQDFGVIRAQIVQQQLEYKKKRNKDKEEARIKEESKKEETEKEEAENKAGFDGTWYTEISTEDKKKRELEEHEREQKKDKEFWDEKSDFTPESRIEAHNKRQEIKDRDKKKEEAKNPPKQPRRLFTEDGRALNINESKIDFTLTEDESENNIVLDFGCYKHLDTSLLDVDVQTNYVRIIVKGKIFQLALDKEVNPDSSSCKRSQTTGHLLVTMPKAKQVVKPTRIPSNTPDRRKNDNKENMDQSKESKPGQIERLEVDASARKTVDIGNIVKEKSDTLVPPLGSRPLRRVSERPNSENFVDNDDVPPLE